MLFLVSLFWNICLTRKGPEEVPAQYALIGLIVIGKIVLVLGVSYVLQTELTALSQIIQIVAWAATTGLLSAVALLLIGKFERFIPTFGAILGTDFIVTGLYGLIFLAVRLTGIDLDPGLGKLLNILVQLWTIYIVGFIMHRALDLNIGLGIAVSLVISIFSQFLSFQMANLT